MRAGPDRLGLRYYRADRGDLRAAACWRPIALMRLAGGLCRVRRGCLCSRPVAGGCWSARRSRCAAVTARQGPGSPCARL